MPDVFIKEDGVEYGPYDTATFQWVMNSGDLTPNAQARKANSDIWIPVTEIKEFYGLQDTASSPATVLSHEFRAGKCLHCGLSEEAAKMRWSCSSKVSPLKERKVGSVPVAKSPSAEIHDLQYKFSGESTTPNPITERDIQVTVLSGVFTCVVGVILTPILIGIPIIFAGLFAIFAPRMCYRWIK